MDYHYHISIKRQEIRTIIEKERNTFVRMKKVECDREFGLKNKTCEILCAVYVVL